MTAIAIIQCSVSFVAPLSKPAVTDVPADALVRCDKSGCVSKPLATFG